MRTGLLLGTTSFLCLALTGCPPMDADDEQPHHPPAAEADPIAEMIADALDARGGARLPPCADTCAGLAHLALEACRDGRHDPECADQVL
ncbi:MAG: hypothetical protein KC620_12280, partial [Myxococcales bacterium]|nr:hypothetical protein [Myxococcales bacterium]